MLVFRDTWARCGNYANESVFLEIEAPHIVGIHHVSEPRFHLTISLSPLASGTVVSWTEVFENPEVADRIVRIVVPSNEQNLDRLTEEVMHGRVSR